METVLSISPENIITIGLMALLFFLVLNFGLAYFRGDVAA